MSREQVRRPEIVVDLGAIRRNVGRLRDLVAPDGSDVMVVVKADGYGHGMLEAASAARHAGAPWLGVATLDEAVRLREARRHRSDPQLADGPRRRLGRRDRPRTSTSRRTPWPSSPRSAPRSRGTPARVQLKIDTGLSRGGSTAELWPELLRGRPRRRGRRRLDGSPASGRTSRPPTSRPTRPTTSRSAPSATRSPGPSGPACAPRSATSPTPPAPCCGRAAASTWSAAASRRTASTRRPASAPTSGCEPAMTVTAPLALTKAIHAGAGVSYGHTWTAPGETRVGLVPLGYGDGVPRHAGNTAEVWVDGKRRPIRGRICMDQFVVDLGDDPGASAGRRGRALRAGHGRRADRRRLGSRLRHHPLRDRHAHGRPPAPALRRRRGRMKASSKVLSVAGAAVGVAAAGTALRVAQRRAVIARRGAGDETEFGSLRSAPITVVAEDGVDLHVEVDEYAATGRRRCHQGARADRGLHPRLLAEPRLLALPARGVPRPGAHGLLRPALPRPLRPLRPGPRDHRAAGPRPQARPRHRGPAGPDRAGRPLDGRDDDHGARRGVPRALRRPDRRGRTDLDHRRRPRAAPDRRPDAALDGRRCRGRAADGGARARPSPGRRLPPARPLGRRWWPPTSSPSATTCPSRTSSSSTRCCRRRRSGWWRSSSPTSPRSTSSRP